MLYHSSLARWNLSSKQGHLAKAVSGSWNPTVVEDYFCPKAPGSLFLMDVVHSGMDCRAVLAQEGKLCLVHTGHAPGRRWPHWPDPFVMILAITYFAKDCSRILLLMLCLFSPEKWQGYQSMVIMVATLHPYHLFFFLISTQNISTSRYLVFLLPTLFSI